MTSEGGVEPDWRRTALEYATRIHVLECIAVADQQSYRKLHEELELCRVCLSDAEGMYSLKCNDLVELRNKVEKAAEKLTRTLESLTENFGEDVVDADLVAEDIQEALEALR